MEQQDGRYYAFHFDDLSVAVDYCGLIVPHVVKRLRSGCNDGIDSPAIWFCAMLKTAGSQPGCDLLMTRGAVLAALEGGLPTPQIGPTARTGLPSGAVLVLGEDSRPSPAPRRGPRPADTEQLLDQVIQLSA